MGSNHGSINIPLLSELWLAQHFPATFTCTLYRKGKFAGLRQVGTGLCEDREIALSFVRILCSLHFEQTGSMSYMPGGGIR
jgi:hypothetical protein